MPRWFNKPAHAGGGGGNGGGGGGTRAVAYQRSIRKWGGRWRRGGEKEEHQDIASTRITIEEASWFLTNALSFEFLSAEEPIGKHVQNNMTILYTSIFSPKMLSIIIGFHSHVIIVIIDDLLIVYKSTKKDVR